MSKRGTGSVNPQIESLRVEEADQEQQRGQAEEVTKGFEQIAACLAEIDVPGRWAADTEDERRVLIDELLDGIEVHAHHIR